MKKNNRIYSFFVASLLMAGLAGCGGGGGGGSSVSTPSPLQGVFTGTNSLGESYEALILEDGSYWNLYGNALVGGGLGVLGFAEGSSSASNGNFTIAYTDFNAPGSTPITGTGSGTYTSSTIVGAATEQGQTVTFSLATPVSTTYVYKTPAVLSAITGTWSGSLLDGETGTVNITAGGAITGTSSLGCSVTGTVTPRPSGDNVFNASLTFGPAPCALPGQSTSGIAITYPLTNGTNQLIVALVTPSLSKATAFFATR